MSRLVDPTICPDCRAPLDAAAVCTGCGLRVQGPVAVQLWGLMVSADALVEQLRATSGRTTPQLLPGGTTGVPGDAAEPDAPRRSRRLPAASVPVVLLGLGALCLLVAAVVFVAVAWSVLGLTGRTLVLLGVTGLLAALAVLVTRRALRGAAETLWLVVAGMLAVDLIAADEAGLAGLDSLSWRATGLVVGLALVLLGVAVGSWARGLEVGRLVGAEAVAVSGALVLCSTNGWGAANQAAGTTVALPLLVAAALLARRRLPVAAYGWAGLAAASWLVLLATGLDRAAEQASFTAWWTDLRGWPLVAAALFAAVPAQLTRLPGMLRTVAAGLALVPLAVLANAPQTVGTHSADLVVGAGTVLGLGLVAAAAPRAWSLAAAGLTTLGLLALGSWLLVAGPWPALAELPTDGSAALDLRLVGRVLAPAAWTAGVVAVVLVAAAACLLRPLPDALREPVGRAVATLAAPVAALGGLVLVLGLEPPLWGGTLAALLATAVAGGASWWSRADPPSAWAAGALTAYLAGLTLYAAAAAHLLSALVATALFLPLVLAAGLRERASARPSAAVTATAAVFAGGWALLAWGQVMSADPEARALVLAAYAGVVAVAAAPLTRRPSTRLSLEGSAGMLAAFAAGYSTDVATVAMVLTVVGSAAALVAVTTRDRVLLGWVAAAVLGLATALRFDEGVPAPEVYTLPAAVLLVVAGGLRLRSDPGVGSFRMLGSGLTLGLVPSLLLALEEPVSLRGALVGVGSVLVLAAGVGLRLAAPFALGAASTGLLVLRHLEPVADAVPRWVSLGVLGLALLLVGITWEARRGNLVTAQRYLTALR